jgi:hypothetical protein
MEKICQDRSQNTFWKERHKLMQEYESTWLIIKDSQGKHIFDSEGNLANVADYYENLYKAPPLPDHTYHEEVMCNMDIFEKNREYENDPISAKAGLEEVKKVINKKKVGKATTDIKNELIKNGGDFMAEMVHAWVTLFWECEMVAD